MKCSINSSTVPCTQLSVRSMNFGQRVPDLTQVRFRVECPTTELLRRLESLYLEFAKDDAEHGDLQEPEEVMQLRLRQWPSLSQLAGESPALLEQFILRHLSYDALLLLFGDVKNEQELRYLINRVDAVSIDVETVTLEGEALELKRHS